MTIGLWILTTIITVLLGIVAFFLKRLIDNIDKLTTTVNDVNETMTLYVYKTDDNSMKITGINGQLIYIHDRLLTIETEHKNRKCK